MGLEGLIYTLLYISAIHLPILITILYAPLLIDGGNINQLTQHIGPKIVQHVCREVADRQSRQFVAVSERRSKS